MNITDLIGKFLLIYTSGVDAKYAISMVIDRVEDIEGRQFVVGVQPANVNGQENWLGNKETFIAWDAVAQFHVFDNYEEFENSIKEEKSEGLFGLFTRQ